MDTLLSLRVFDRVVTLGSFTRAADSLGLSVAMASKHVRHLEQHLQTRLLHRSSRRLSLTEAGQAYHGQCAQALATLDEARQSAMQGTATAQGELRLTAPTWCATPYVAQVLADYRAAHPAVTLSLHLDNQHTDMVAAGIDVALRVTATPEPHLIVRPLTQVPFSWVASAAYVAQHGLPQAGDDLARHHGLLPDYVTMSTALPRTAESNDTLMLYQLACADMGVAFLPEWVTAPDLAAGRLLRVPAGPPKLLTLYATYVNRAYLSAKVRSLIDFLAARWPEGAGN